MVEKETMREYYLAGDPAKQHDFFGIVVLERIDKNIKLIAHKELQFDYNIVANYIQTLHKKYHFRSIFLDQTGIGNVFVDMLKSKNHNVRGITLSNPKKVEIMEYVVRLMQEERIKLPKNGAKELKQQLQEQERNLTQSGMVRLVHPQNAHDDLFWAFCIGCYGIKPYLDDDGHFSMASKTFHIDPDDILGSGVPRRDGIKRLGRAVHWPS